MKMKNTKRNLFKNPFLYGGGLMLLNACSFESIYSNGFYNINSVKEVLSENELEKNDSSKTNLKLKKHTFEEIKQTVDGGFIAVGYDYLVDKNNEKKDNNALIVKYDANGNKQWMKNFGGSSDDSFYSVVEISDGFIAVGCSNSTDAGFDNKGSADSIIVKYDVNGNKQWVRTFGGSEYNCFNSIIETSNKEIVVVGFEGINNKYEAILIKYDEDGDELWKKNLNYSNYDVLESVIEVPDGFVAVGYSRDSDFNNSIIVKYDMEGNKQWINTYDSSSYSVFESVVEVKDGAYVAIGYSNDYTNKDNTNYHVVKYDKNGTQEWVRNYKEYDIKSLTKSPDGKYIAIWNNHPEYNTNLKNDSLIIKYDENGNQEWVKNLNVYESNPNKDEDTEEDVNNSPGSNEEDVDLIDENSTDDKVVLDNILTVTLDTQAVKFENVNSIDDLVQEKAINITIDSNLPYQINSYLVTDMQNNDKTKTMPREVFNIKESSESSYFSFKDVDEKMVLKDDCPAGINNPHSVDIMLKGGIAYEKDSYRATIKIEVEQK